MEGGNKRRLLLLAAAAFAGLAAGSQSFLRPTACAPAALSSTAVNSSGAVGSLLECALRCIGASWCAAMLAGSSDCALISWELYYGSWVGQGADCPDGLYEKEAGALEWLPFSNCQQIDETPAGPCSKATDGNTNQHFAAGSCTHTNHNSSNWWRASLPQPAYVDRVVVYNRQDSCCAHRLNNFTISLDGAVFASYYEPSIFSLRNFSCGRVGQTVQVDQHFSNALTLCEVIVYGRRIP